jgi:hypothetical protein
MMTRVLLQILAQVRPAASNAHHDALAVLAYEADEELDGCFARGAGEVVEFNFWVAACGPRAGFGLAVSGGEQK